LALQKGFLALFHSLNISLQKPERQQHLTGLVKKHYIKKHEMQMKHKLMTVLQPQEPNKFVAVHRERSMADRAKFKVNL
jgi:hypothetical protein